MALCIIFVDLLAAVFGYDRKTIPYNYPIRARLQTQVLNSL